MAQKRAAIIGAGPAGLVAAYELLKRTGIKPVVYEMGEEIGGISRTAKFKGNRIDIGGHRFFSKSARVMDWWQEIFPLQGAPSRDDRMLGRSVPLKAGGPDPEKEDRVMLSRTRISRVYFSGALYNYPIRLCPEAVSQLGIGRAIRIGASYCTAVVLRRRERTLEDFLINRFGAELYRMFFRDYTLKVWGRPCSEISPEWGRQRIKGLSIGRAISHALKNIAGRDDTVEQKTTETTLIGRFMYPKYGPGQFWERVACLVNDMGGEVHTGKRVTGLRAQDGRITGVMVRDERRCTEESVDADFVLSSMPVRGLIKAFGTAAPGKVKSVADGLLYRDFVTVGLLLRRLKPKGPSDAKKAGRLIPDNWIYIQEKSVKMARIQIFNNWSPYMVADPSRVWVGLEYPCDESGDIWRMAREQMIRRGAGEMAYLGFIDPGDVIDGTVVRTPSAYPAYFGTYDRMHLIRDFTDRYENLFLIGRNGQHRYNNTDHSMLTAMRAVDMIAEGNPSKDPVWAVNVESDYIE